MLAALPTRLLLVAACHGLLGPAGWAGEASATLLVLLEELAASPHAEDLGRLPFDPLEQLAALPDARALDARRAWVEEAAARLAASEQAGPVPGALADRRATQLWLLGLERERLALLRALHESDGGQPWPGGPLATAPEGDAWYRLRLRAFTSSDASPEDVRALGERALVRAQARVAGLRSALGLQGDDAYAGYRDDPRYVLTDRGAILARYERIARTVADRAPSLFGDRPLPEVTVRPDTLAGAMAPPAWYEPRRGPGGTFIFNFWDGRHDRRAMAFLSLHEAVPGHALQSSVVTSIAATRAVAFFPGYAEGWAAYVENLAPELGAYEDAADELGRWEWDLVRSTRVLIDVGLHHDGWSRDRADAFWSEHVPHGADIAEREIERILRWPGQVVSYKVGEHRLLDLAAQAEAAGLGLIEFHGLVLDEGPAPWPVVTARVERRLAERADASTSR